MTPQNWPWLLPAHSFKNWCKKTISALAYWNFWYCRGTLLTCIYRHPVLKYVIALAELFSLGAIPFEAVNERGFKRTH